MFGVGVGGSYSIGGTLQSTRRIHVVLGLRHVERTTRNNVAVNGAFHVNATKGSNASPNLISQRPLARFVLLPGIRKRDAQN